MKNEREIDLRQTGIGVLGEIPWGSHFCHFYETQQDLLDTVVPYFKAGLESKEFCIWAVTAPLTMEEARRALEKAVPDIREHFLKENIEFVDGVEWYLGENGLDLERALSAWAEKLQQALARGYEGLRVSGDAFWLREEDRKDFHSYEKQLVAAITDQRMIVLCTYPLAKCAAAEVLDVVEAHHFAIARRAGDWDVIQSPEPILAKAEIRRLSDELQRFRAETPKPSLILSYGVSVLSVAAALLITLWMRMEIGQPSTPIMALFLCAVMFSAWFGGVGPGLLAIGLALLAIDYYFGVEIYSFGVEMMEMPRLLVFAVLALLVGGLSVAQRRKAESLRRARDVLEGTVQQLKQTNEALRGENAERKRAEEEVKAASEQLRKLSASLQSAIENERTRIARELHDELGSSLAVLKWGVEEIGGLSKALPREEILKVREKLDTLTAMIDTTFSTVRRISSELRPGVLDEAGLVAAIESAAKQFEARTGITCRFAFSKENLRLSPEQSIAVYRIFQEVLTNILRHAEATTVEINMMDEGGEFVLTVTDNGKGITAGQQSGAETLGILGMQERAHLMGGEVAITRAARGGTVVSVRVPIARREIARGMTR